MDYRSKVIFAEADKAERKYRPVIVILFFLAIYLIFSTVASILMTPLMMHDVMRTDDYRLLVDRFAVTGKFDTEAMMDLLTVLSPTVFLVQLFSFALVYPVCFFFMRKLEKRSYASAGFVKGKIIKNYLTGYLIGAAVMIMCGAFCLITSNGSFTPAVKPNVLYIVLCFLGYIIQGAGEEIMCRGVLFVSLRNSMKNRARVPIAVLLSSLAFAILHSFNPGMTFLSFFNLFLSGVFFALMLIRFDNIWVCCAAHSAWNFFQGNVLGAQVSGMDTRAYSILNFKGTGSGLINGGNFGFEGGLACTIVSVILILLLWFLPSFNKPKTGGNTDEV